MAILETLLISLYTVSYHCKQQMFYVLNKAWKTNYIIEFALYFQCHIDVDKFVFKMSGTECFARGGMGLLKGSFCDPNMFLFPWLGWW